MPVRGLRGATTVDEDQSEMIQSATMELLRALMAANPSLHPIDIASGFFTVTEDLRSAFPAQAVREMGWSEVALMCAVEISVPKSLPRCIRVLIHWNTDISQNEIHHVYLREAIHLRPDLKR